MVARTEVSTKIRAQNARFRGCASADSQQPLDFLLPLHIDDAGDLADSRNNPFQVLHIFDIDSNVDGSATIAGTDIHVADVGVVVADDGGDLLQHAGTIVAYQRQLHRIGRLRRTRNRSAGSAPTDIDAAVGFVHEIGHVWAGLRMNGNASAASDEADDLLAANRI